MNSEKLGQKYAYKKCILSFACQYSKPMGINDNCTWSNFLLSKLNGYAAMIFFSTNFAKKVTWYIPFAPLDNRALPK